MHKSVGGGGAGHAPFGHLKSHANRQKQLQVWVRVIYYSAESGNSGQ